MVIQLSSVEDYKCELYPEWVTLLKPVIPEHFYSFRLNESHLIDHKTLSEIVQRSVVGLPLPRRFDLDINPLIAPTPPIATDVTPEQMTFV